MPKRLEVDHWRTSYWAARLLLRTGLTEKSLERRLIELRKPSDGFFERSGSFKKYVRGKRTASLYIERGKGASAILLADRIAPGSFWDFCLPLYDLLEELCLWREPEKARERFVRRIRAETRVAHLARNREPFEEPQRLIISPPSTVIQEGYGRLQRIRRAMLSIDGLPVEVFFRSSLPLEPGFFRTVRPLQQEAAVLNFPPTIRDFSIALFLCLEATETADIDRYACALELLLATRSGLDADACMKPLADEIWQFIESEFPQPDELRNCQSDARIARAMAPLTSRELLSATVLRQVATEYERLRPRIPLNRAVYVLD